MFETRKTITVKDVSFDMILVEGDKFHIGDREYELEDFYMAEIPVTQELYMGVMGPAHTGSYNMMPDNFDYLNPKNPYFRNVLVPNESIEDYQKRIERESIEKRKREDKERDRVKKFAASLPVNNISWLEAIAFINRLNQLTGLNFALPSFEQWYYAASGGVKSKGYAFAGSDDANAVGHFNSLSTIIYSTGLYVMNNGLEKDKPRKAGAVRYEKPKQYKPNELGLYDMSGLVNEWLDEAGMIIGGSYYSNPDQVDKKHRYGYTRFDLDRSLSYEGLSVVCSSATLHNRQQGNFYGLRLILCNKQKKYEVPKEPDFSIKPTPIEEWLCGIIANSTQLGMFRSIVGSKYVRPATIRCHEERFAYGSFQCGIYNIFVCPQNLSSFTGHCFEKYSSRRNFIAHCKDEFLKLLKILCNGGASLIIKDNLGLGLTETGIFSPLEIKLGTCTFRSKKDEKVAAILAANTFVTNNPDVVAVTKFTSTWGRKTKYDELLLPDNLILIEINDTLRVQASKSISNEWLCSFDAINSAKMNVLRLTLNCFCDLGNADDGFIKDMKDFVLHENERIRKDTFDNSERINDLFGKRNKGGLFECKFPDSSGEYLLHDEKFYILPEPVFDEWSQSLKGIKQ